MVGEASGRMQKADCRDEIALPAAMLAWLKYRKQRTRNSRKRFLVFVCFCLWLYKFFWGLGGTYPFHCGVLTPYLYTCWGNKRPPKSMLSLTRGTHHNFDSIKRTEILTMSS